MACPRIYAHVLMLFAGFFLSRIAHAATAEPVRVAVHMMLNDEAGWYDAALEESIKYELGQFSGIVFAQRSELIPMLCFDDMEDCLLEAYDAEFLVLGRREAQMLRLMFVERGSIFPAAETTLSLSGPAALSKLRYTLVSALQPMIRHRRNSDLFLTDQIIMHEQVEVLDASDLQLGLGLLLLLVLLPLLALRLKVDATKRAALAHSSTWQWTALMALSIGGLIIFLSTSDLSLLQEASMPSRYDWLLPTLGGVLWGTFALVFFRLALPPLWGMARVHHQTLGPLLGTWIVVCCVRTLLLVVAYAPIMLAAYFGLPKLGLDADILLFLGLPGAGLLSYIWNETVIDNMSLFLDSHFVDGQVDPSNAWNRTAKRYFGGYLKRLGVEIADKTLHDLLILRGVRDGVFVYGGGFSKTRVVVSSVVLETALGSVDERRSAERQDFGFTDWHRGAVVPLSVLNHKRIKKLHQKRKKLERAYLRHSVNAKRGQDTAPRLLGQHVTHLGSISPQTAGDSLPLISNDREDFKVVRELLTEHYAAFEQGGYGDEYDDTDPTQKDFLFGVLLRAVGESRRFDTFFLTADLVFKAWFVDSSMWWSRLARFLHRVYERVKPLHGTLIADAYVALNHGRDHLIQYLAYTLNHDNASAFTVRADAPHLQQTSYGLLRKSVFADGVGLRKSEPTKRAGKHVGAEGGGSTVELTGSDLRALSEDGDSTTPDQSTGGPMQAHGEPTDSDPDSRADAAVEVTPPLVYARTLNRLEWLSDFLNPDLRKKQRRRRGLWGALVLLIGLLIVGGIAVQESIEYNVTYQERINP